MNGESGLDVTEAGLPLPPAGHTTTEARAGDAVVAVLGGARSSASESNGVGREAKRNPPAY